ncbi:F-box/WD repeat-containing protein 7 [Sergentomyia squamirostris]
MEEECVVVASIVEDSQRFSETSQDLREESSEELIISGEADDEIASLPYDNTPLVSLNNSTSDLNGTDTGSDGAPVSTTSPTFSSAMSPGGGVTGGTVSAGEEDEEDLNDAAENRRQQEPPSSSMECEEEETTGNHEKVQMIFETPVVHDDDVGEKILAPTATVESTVIQQLNHRSKGASVQETTTAIRTSSSSSLTEGGVEPPLRRESEDNDHRAEVEEEGGDGGKGKEKKKKEHLEPDELGGMCVIKVSCKKRARKRDEETIGASCSKAETMASGPNMRHAPAAAAAAKKEEEEVIVADEVSGVNEPPSATSSTSQPLTMIAEIEETLEATTADHHQCPDEVEVDDDVFPPEEDHAADVIYDENDVQSMDAIERRDFEREQRLIGGVIIRNKSIVSGDNKLKLNILNQFATTDEIKREKIDSCGGSTTPTSSRSSTMRSSKVKINLSSCLVAKQEAADEEESEAVNDEREDVVDESIIVNSQRKSCRRRRRSLFLDGKEEFDAMVNTNSNDSLSSDRSSIIAPYITSQRDEVAAGGGAGCSKASTSTAAAAAGPSKAGPSSVTAATQTTSSQTSPTCQFAGDEGELGGGGGGNFLDVDDVGEGRVAGLLVDPEASSSRRSSSRLMEPDATIPPESEHDFEEDTWGDCDEGSDVEEVCTCREYTDEENVASSEDELLPSRDVDLSGYTYDYVHETSGSHETPRVSRKRKISEIVYLDGSFMDGGVGGGTGSGGRKRITLEKPGGSTLLSPSSSSAATMSPMVINSPSSEKRTPRSIIPTKDNPPPELGDWLVQFQRWSQPERLLALDRLIDLCEPTQVRHMMKVIEPQFQRDFISLLPKELALQVLSYLEPKDLLRAAQTCRNWRFLCDDNLLWKEKCKKAGIGIEGATDRPKRGRAGNMPPISSPWKAAYIRQSIIEMNWRSRPVREPKVLKGHDDHVITCLQFCGNRIVSGSDDNTLKVWSAITGKCLRTLVGHTGGVWSSQMSANIIISGSTDRTLKVWNADTGQCIHTLYGHTSTVRCMHLHGNKVVSGSRDATLRVWDVTRGICLHILVGHMAAVRCVQYDGKLVVSGAYDYMVKVWNPEKAECLHTLQGHSNRVYSLQFDGIHVVSGSLDTSIRVWDAETGSCKHTLMGHQSLTSGMELRQNILVSGNADSTVKVWDILTGQCLQTLSGPNKHQSAVTCLQFNSRFVITSSDDGTVKLWDVKTGEFIRNLVALDSGGSGGVVWRIRANDTKLICAVGSRNGTEETKLMVLDFDVEGACLKCS